MDDTMSFISRSRYALVLVCLVAACSGGEKPAASDTGPNPADTRMNEGLNLLYQRNDPFGAEVAFRDVLKQNPSHYGAHFQLARAIDREGKPSEARPMWQDVLKSA